MKLNNENDNNINNDLEKGVLLDTELDENDWDGLISDFKKVVPRIPRKRAYF